MKKLLVAIFSIAIILGLSACGKQTESSSQKQSNSSETVAVDASGEKQELETKQSNDNPITSIKIDGEEYTFPMTYEKFKSYGWIYCDPESDDISQWPTTIAPNTNKFLDYNKDGIEYLEFCFFNDTDQNVTLDKCKITGINVEYNRTIEGESGINYMKIPNGSIVFNDEVSIGETDVATVSKCFNLNLSSDAEAGSISPDSLSMFMYFSFDENGIMDSVQYVDQTLAKRMTDS